MAVNPLIWSFTLRARLGPGTSHRLPRSSRPRTPRSSSCS